MEYSPAENVYFYKLFFTHQQTNWLFNRAVKGRTIPMLNSIYIKEHFFNMHFVPYFNCNNCYLYLLPTIT